MRKPKHLFVFHSPTPAPFLPLSLLRQLPFQLVVLLAWSALSASASSGAGVTWMSPSAGDAYASGATMVGQWSAKEGFADPSFSLCAPSSQEEGGDAGDSCGAEVWPVVSSDGGSYLIYLSLPNVSSTAQFYLQMADDAGQTAGSPAFSLNPSPATASAGSLSSPNGTPPSSPSASPQGTGGAQPLPNLASTRMPAPTAAYAVPLALAGAVLVVVGGLGVRQRRKLQRERAEAERGGKAAEAGAGGGADEKGVGAGGVVREDVFTRFPGMRRVRTGRGMGMGERSMGAGSVCSGRGSTMGWGSRASSPTAAVRSVAGSFRGLPNPYADEVRSLGEEEEEDGDRLSLYSVASMKRQSVKRRVTREAYWPRWEAGTGTGTRQGAGTRGRRMAAGAFRAGVVPVRAGVGRFSSSGFTGWGCGRGERSKERDGDRNRDRAMEMEKGLNASVEDALVEEYFLPEPVSPSEPAPLERLHVRRCAEGRGGSADREKPLPARPARGRGW